MSISQKSVTIKDQLIEKTNHPSLMRIEVEKTRKAYEIGKNSGLFRVPRVIDFDESKGIAKFERIHNIEHISNVIALKRNSNKLIENVGKALAIIHEELKLPDNMIHPLPNEFQLSGSEVFIHGDFNGINVCVDQNDGSIILLDWQMTSVHGGKSTYGSRYFDIFFFLNYLFLCSFHTFVMKNKISPIAKIFIKYYFKNSKYPFKEDEFKRYMKRFLKNKHVLKYDMSLKRRIFLTPNYIKMRIYFASFNYRDLHKL